MKKTYPLESRSLDFASQIQRHSADKTVFYKAVDEENINLCYFYPNPVPEKAAPAIVLVHGGGWANHKIFPDQNGLWQGDYLGYLARYYADKGFVCVCVDYRLSKEDGQCHNYQLIDCYDDCADAMDYILDHASENFIDDSHVHILGESAGGHLAGMLACLYRNGGFRFRSALLVNAVLNLADCPIWKQRVPKITDHPILKQMDFAQRAQYLSPVYQTHSQLCPVVLIHGREDTTVPLYHSEVMYEKLRNLGVPCHLHIIEGTRHAFLLAEYTSNTCANQIGVSILNEHLLTQ